MPQVCRVCAHKDTARMEKDYLNGLAKTKIAREYNVPSQSVDYHMDNHLSAKLVKHVDKKEREHTQDLFSNIQQALDEANDILQEARDKKQNRLSLDAIKTILSANELFAKMIAKTKEFEATDREKKENKVAGIVSEGLEALSTAELKCLIQLMGKVHSSDPDYELNEQSRLVVESMNSIQMGFGNNNSPRTRPTEDRNSQKQGADQPEPKFEDLDDWDDDFDLDLDDLNLSNEIPSERTDPK